MPILADISPDHRLPIIMKPKDPPQAKCRVEIPGVIARTEGTVQLNLPPIRVGDRPPHPRPLEIFEHPSEEHVPPLLLDVDTAGPLADIEAVASEPAGQELVPLFPA